MYVGRLAQQPDWLAWSSRPCRSPRSCPSFLRGPANPCLRRGSGTRRCHRSRSLSTHGSCNNRFFHRLRKPPNRKPDPPRRRTTSTGCRPGKPQIASSAATRLRCRRSPGNSAPRRSMPCSLQSNSAVLLRSGKGQQNTRRRPLYSLPNMSQCL